ncbi:MAG: hypothetical protein B7X49_17825 [Acidiphilium sp. 34-64-41]|nr:MAG: hypothetical protein B7X49_17825 [Acidiphilium sp. 34-64-41]
MGNGAKQRARRYRENLSARGVALFQVAAPESARPLFREAAELMVREDDPLAPHAAFRKVGGANDPGMQMMAEELAATRLASQAAAARVLALEAELDVAKKATTIEQKRSAAIAAKAQISEKVAADTQKRAEEALGRAKKAETAIRQVKTLPGLKGRLVRWLAGDVLPD